MSIIPSPALENTIYITHNANLTCRQTWLLRRIQRKLFQMTALWKQYQLKG